MFNLSRAVIVILWVVTLSNTACAAATGKQAMDSNQICQQTPLKKSQELIRFILDDMTKTYTQVGGGGITAIKLAATNTFVVSVSQEERIDQITYELAVDGNCAISIVKREVTATTPWQK